jgi:hypothetical protein
MAVIDMQSSDRVGVTGQATGREDVRRAGRLRPGFARRRGSRPRVAETAQRGKSGPVAEIRVLSRNQVSGQVGGSTPCGEHGGPQGRPPSGLYFGYEDCGFDPGRPVPARR